MRTLDYMDYSATASEFFFIYVIVAVYLLICVWLFCNPMNCSPPGSSVHEIFQARTLSMRFSRQEHCPWDFPGKNTVHEIFQAFSFSRGSSHLKDWTQVSCIAGEFFTTEPPGRLLSIYCSVARWCNPMDCSTSGFPSSGVCSNSCPLSRWWHPTVSSSSIPFSCLQSFPASGSFPVSQLFASSDQSIRASASASGLPMNIQSRFPLG